MQIFPSKVNGTATAPASKSIMQRACALALLHNGKTIIENFGNSNDDIAAIEIIKNLGALIVEERNKLIIKSNGLQNNSNINSILNCGESGLCARMFAPIAALLNKEITINGEGSLLNRPINLFTETFSLLNVEYESNNNHLPIKVKGQLHPTDIIINGSESSQYLTGLLITFAKAATKQVTINVINLKSKAYIDVTLSMLNQFGYNNIINNNYEKFIITPSTLPINKKINCPIESDWSNAAFLLVAGAIAGSVTVKNININSLQADKAIIKVLMQSGCNILINDEANQITCTNNTLKPFEFDATDCPDLFPPLVALAAYCNGISKIIGVSRLVNKESNRGITLKDEFAKMGVTINIINDSMFIKGGNSINGGIINSHNDHRIAMAVAIAALGATTNTVIENSETVKKSYPNFFNDLQKLIVF